MNVQQPDAGAVDPFAFSLQDSSIEEFRRHLFDGVADCFSGSVEAAVADGAMALPAASWKEVRRRVEIEWAHCLILSCGTALSEA